MRADPGELEAKIGHSFARRDLLIRALTHASYPPEAAAGALLQDNEQLEFLGDAVLGFLVSDALVKRYPGWDEGRLSRLKAHLVSASYLTHVARALGLGEHLVLGRSEEISGGRDKRTLLSDALEGVLAAVYLDAGIAKAQEFVERWVLDALDTESEAAIPPEITDYIGELITESRIRKLPLPKFEVVRTAGPEHSKVFVVEARLGRELSGYGEGSTKKQASQRAAQQALERLRALPA